MCFRKGGEKRREFGVGARGAARYFHLGESFFHNFFRPGVFPLFSARTLFLKIAKLSAVENPLQFVVSGAGIR